MIHPLPGQQWLPIVEPSPDPAPLPKRKVKSMNEEELKQALEHDQAIKTSQAVASVAAVSAASVAVTTPIAPPATEAPKFGSDADIAWRARELASSALDASISLVCKARVAEPKDVDGFASAAERCAALARAAALTADEAEARALIATLKEK